MSGLSSYMLVPGISATICSGESMQVLESTTIVLGSEKLQRVEYIGAQGYRDWALLRLPERGRDWVVCIHGHGSQGDQLYIREDIRTIWLPEFIKLGLGILTPNLRGNAWMDRQATEDMRDLLDVLRTDWGAGKFMFASGSMGGSSSLIYACLHPEDVGAVVALGAAADLYSYVNWCREGEGVVQEIADAIESGYGPVLEKPDIYLEHSVLANAGRLKMPVYISHGCLDQLMPVSQVRELCGLLAEKQDLVYAEIAEGDHDSPLHSILAFAWAAKRMQEGI